jgi:dTDP-4-dehydrorhamnose 3,5-epimerase
MGQVNLSQIIESPLKIINVQGGDVLHALKFNEKSFINFGEAYFSKIEKDVIKGWKLHTKMTLNLVVPIGEVEFKFVSEDFVNEKTYIIGNNNYSRLTVPANIWFGFRGLASPYSLILNLADILHDPEEVRKISQNDFIIKF